jgi:hypothetical protein
MPFSSNKYLYLFLQHSILSIGLILFFAPVSFAQTKSSIKDTINFLTTTVYHSAANNTKKVTSNLNEWIKRPDKQLMNWQAYYLTPAEREARDRKQTESIDQFKSFRAFTTYTFKSFTNYVAEDFVTSWLNKKNNRPPAKIPRF